MHAQLAHLQSLLLAKTEAAARVAAEGTLENMTAAVETSRAYSEALAATNVTPAIRKALGIPSRGGHSCRAGKRQAAEREAMRMESLRRAAR